MATIAEPTPRTLTASKAWAALDGIMQVLGCDDLSSPDYEILDAARLVLVREHERLDPDTCLGCEMSKKTCPCLNG